VILFWSVTKPKPIKPPVRTQEQIEEERKDAWVVEKLALLTPEEKIGQMLMLPVGSEILTGSPSSHPIAQIPVGGVLITGNHTTEELRKITEAITSLPWKVAPFIAIDQEGGPVKRLTDDPNPGAAVLSTKTDEEICETYKKTTQLLKEAGVNMNFGIVADVGWFPDGYITSRTFGRGPEPVARLVKLAVECSKAAAMLTTVKHFPGHGRTRLDSHTTIPTVLTSYEDWKATDSLPFQAGIDAGADVVMLGHLVYEQIATEPASLSERWASELRDMGFSGLIITDDVGMMMTTESIDTILINENIFSASDMVLLVSSKQKINDFFQKIKQKFQSEDSLNKTLIDKVRRIL